MRPWLLGLSRVSCIICVFSYGRCCAAQQFEIKRSNHYDDMVEERTFLFGKLVLVPVLAVLGLKFLALVPIVLTKIALLSAMNFLSTNLNLLISTLFGLKNFLGKFGLWAETDNKRHPELEAFTELANQPIPILQPSYRYQYLTDTQEFAKTPSLTKVLSGFEPTASGLYRAKFDRRTKSTDKRHVLKTKQVPSATVGTHGRYKCYWTNNDSDVGVQTNSAKLMRESIDESKLHAPKIDLHSYLQDSDVYAALNKEINEPLRKSVLSSNLPDYRPLVNKVPSQQVATHGSAEKIDNEVGTHDGHGQAAAFHSESG